MSTKPVSGRKWTWAAVALLGLALASLAGGMARAGTDKSVLVVGQLQFLKNFHPLIQVNNTKRLQISYGLLPITAFDEHAVNQCVLCETLPTLENGLAKIVKAPHGASVMKVTIILRQGLRWVGPPVDVVATKGDVRPGAIGRLAN